MKIAVVKSSDLGERWDAGFHVAASEVRDRVEYFKSSISAEEAARRVKSIPEADLKPLQAIVRGEGKNFDMKAVNRAIRENPHLALAVMERNLQPAFDRIREEIERHQRQIESLQDLADFLDLEIAPASPCPR